MKIMMQCVVELINNELINVNDLIYEQFLYKHKKSFNKWS